MNEVYEIDGEKYHYNGKNWVDCYNCVAPLAIQQKLKVMAKKDTVATRLKKPLKPINTVTLKVSPKQDTKNCIEHLKNLGYGYDYSTKVYFIMGSKDFIVFHRAQIADEKAQIADKKAQIVSVRALIADYLAQKKGVNSLYPGVNCLSQGVNSRQKGANYVF